MSHSAPPTNGFNSVFKTFMDKEVVMKITSSRYVSSGLIRGILRRNKKDGLVTIESPVRLRVNAESIVYEDPINTGEKRTTIGLKMDQVTEIGLSDGWIQEFSDSDEGQKRKSSADYRRHFMDIRE